MPKLWAGPDSHVAISRVSSLASLGMVTPSLSIISRERPVQIFTLSL